MQVRNFGFWNLYYTISSVLLRIANLIYIKLTSIFYLYSVLYKWWIWIFSPCIVIFLKKFNFLAPTIDREFDSLRIRNIWAAIKSFYFIFHPSRILYLPKILILFISFASKIYSFHFHLCDSYFYAIRSFSFFLVDTFNFFVFYHPNWLSLEY